MRLGVSGFTPRELDAVDDKLAATIAELGFTGVVTHFLGDPATLPAAALHRARDVLAHHGIRIVQSWGWQQPLVHPDDAVRRKGIDVVHHALRVAAELKADMLMSGPGSRNPRGSWWPHPQNHSAETEDTLVHSLQAIMPACEKHGIPFALECHVASPLDSAGRTRRVIERVGSPWLKVSIDPVNFVADLPTLYDTAGMVNHLFDTLGPHIIAAHVKDVYAEDRHVVHISETVPGQGVFDFDTFCRRFEQTVPDGFAIIEHLPVSLVPQAMAFMQDKLRALGIRVRG